MSSHNGCVTDYSQTYWPKPKPTSFMLTNSGPLEFRQGPQEVCFCLWCLGGSAGRLEGWGWNHLMTSSLTCVVVDAGCWLEASVPFYVIYLLGKFGFPQNMMTGLQSKIPKERIPEKAISIL